MFNSLLFFIVLGHPIEIQLVQNPSPEQFLAVDETKSVLFNNVTELWEIKPLSDEPPKRIIKLESGWIANFAYLHERFYALCTLSRAEGGGLIRRVFFYNLDGTFQSQGRLRHLPDETDNLYFRQIIPSGDRLFVNIWKRKGNLSNESRMLQEVRLEDHDRWMDIIFEAEPFKKNFDVANSVTTNMKRKWILTKELGDDGEKKEKILVIDELEPKLWYFSKQSDNFEPEGFTLLKLNWKPATDFVEKKAKMSPRRFYSSMDRVTGFFDLDDFLLFGIQTANQNFDWESSEAMKAQGISPTQLQLVLTDLNGKLLLEQPETQKGYLAGVFRDGPDGDQAVLIHNRNGKYEIDLLNLPFD